MHDSIPSALSNTEIAEAAKLYRKESLRPLSEYQKRMNEEAAKLAIKNPVLIQRGHRHDLLERAREVVSASYQFKKGKSRSKKLSPQSDESCTPVNRPKKIDSEVRGRRIRELEEDLKQFDQQILFKEKRRDQAESVRNYKLCDELTEEVGKLKATRREAFNELKLFQKKEKQARWYQEKRRRSTDGSAEKKPKKSRGSGGFFSDSDTPLESPSSVATDATVLLSDSGSEMELGHPSCSSLSASGASTEDVVTVVDADDRTAASSATATTPSAHQSLGRSCSLTPMSLFPVPKVKSSSSRRRYSSSTVTPTSTPSRSPSSEPFSPPIISARGRSPLLTFPKSSSSSRGRSPTFFPAPTQSHSSTPEASRSPSPLPGPIHSPVSVPSRSNRSRSPMSKSSSPIPSEAHPSSPPSSEAHSVSTRSFSGDQQVFSQGLPVLSSSEQGGLSPN